MDMKRISYARRELEKKPNLFWKWELDERADYLLEITVQDNDLDIPEIEDDFSFVNIFLTFVNVSLCLSLSL